MCNIRPFLNLAQSSQRISCRELSVAGLATLDNADIAIALNISVNTVKMHLFNIKRKTGLETRAAIAVWADRLTRRAA